MENSLFLGVPILKHITVVWTNFLFLFTFKFLLSQTADISKLIFWDKKIHFEISVVWNELQIHRKLSVVDKKSAELT